MNTNKPEIYIFDIDGTLASHDHRGPFEEHKVLTDGPILPVLKVLNALLRDSHNVVFISGRTKACEKDTRQWLNQHLDINGEDLELYMREVGDQRKDSIVKKEIYDKFITPVYDIIGVFDDRMQVCEMLYENNIFCFNVNQGLKHF